MDATASAAAAADLCLVQSPTPTESSLLWDFQAAFYKQQGMQCWVQNTVPSFVTSNAFVANAYARVLMGFLRDWYASGRADRSQPVHIIEVGAGHGKLSFLILRELMDAWQAWPDLGRDSDVDVDSSVQAYPFATPLHDEVSLVSGPHGTEGAKERRAMRLTGRGVRTFGHGPGGRRAPFRLIITDFSDGTLPWWQSHESLQPYIEAGVCDFGHFDAEKDDAITLRVAKAADGVGPLVLSSGTLANPVLGIANYTLDTLRQGVFRFIGGALQQGMASLYSSSSTDAEAVAAAVAAADARGTQVVLDGSMLRNLRIVWSYRPVSLTRDGSGLPTLDEVCPDPVAACVIRAYAARPSINAGTCLNIPIGGLAAMRRLSALSSGRLFLIAGDKSYAHEAELVAVGLTDPHVAQHASCSFMVNMHALRLASLALGAGSCFSLHTPYLDGFKVSAFLWDTPTVMTGGQGMGKQAITGAKAWAAAQAGAVILPQPEELWQAASHPLPSWATTAWPETTFAWVDTMDTFGPDNFGTLQRCVRDEIADPTLKLALATIRMSCWDPDVAFKFKQTLIDKAPGVSEHAQADVYRDVQAIYARYFPLSPSKDTAFELGRVCMGLRRYHEAIAMFWASIRHTGEHHVTVYNIGICLYHLGSAHFPGAKAAFVRSLALKPDYEDAAAWRTRVEARISGDTLAASVA